jgi:hypothetical protein
MKIVRLVLQGIGALAVLGLVLALGAAAVLAPKFMERTDWASREDVEPILQWSGLDAKQPLTVLRSYKSAWEADGDYRTFICAQLEADAVGEGWSAGPEANPVMAAARTRAAKRGEAAQCFGREADGNAPEISAFIQVAQTYRREVDGAQIAFFDAKTKRLLYAGFHD